MAHAMSKDSPFIETLLKNVSFTLITHVNRDVIPVNQTMSININFDLYWTTN